MDSWRFFNCPITGLWAYGVQSGVFTQLVLWNSMLIEILISSKHKGRPNLPWKTMIPRFQLQKNWCFLEPWWMNIEISVVTVSTWKDTCLQPFTDQRVCWSSWIFAGTPERVGFLRQQRWWREGTRESCRASSGISSAQRTSSGIYWRITCRQRERVARLGDHTCRQGNFLFFLFKASVWHMYEIDMQHVETLGEFAWGYYLAKWCGDKKRSTCLCSGLQEKMIL